MLEEVLLEPVAVPVPVALDPPEELRPVAEPVAEPVVARELTGVGEPVLKVPLEPEPAEPTTPVAPAPAAPATEEADSTTTGTKVETADGVPAGTVATAGWEVMTEG